MAGILVRLPWKPSPHVHLAPVVQKEHQNSLACLEPDIAALRKLCRPRLSKCSHACVCLGALNNGGRWRIRE